MDARNPQELTLSDLPAEVVGHEICPQLSMGDILALRAVANKYRRSADIFIQNVLPNIPLRFLLNHDYNHFPYLYSVLLKNPTILKPLQNPDALLTLCLQLTPLGLQRLSIIFPLFPNELYQPIETATQAGNFIASICYALFTTNIETIDLALLSQTTIWLDLPNNREAYAAIYRCLITIERVRQTMTYVDTTDFPTIPSYLNLQGSSQLASAKLRRITLRYANLAEANLQHTELQDGKLYGTYLEESKTYGIHLWNTTFFDLSDKKATLTNQLDMLDAQLRYDKENTKLDEAITADLLNQITAIKDPIEKTKAYNTAHNHRFFTNRLNNINLRIAFTNACKDLAKPNTATLFGQSRLSSAWRTKQQSANPTPKY